MRRSIHGSRDRREFLSRSVRSTIRRGAILAMALVTLLVVGMIAGLMVQRYLAAHRQASREVQQLQAEWLAEAAVARGLALRQADEEYADEMWRVELPEPGGATIRIEPAKQAGRIKIVVEARYPDHESQRALVERTYTLPLTTAPPAAPAGPTP